MAAGNADYHDDWLFTAGRHDWVSHPQDVRFFHKGQHGRVSGFRGHIPLIKKGRNAGASAGEFAHWERSLRKHQSKDEPKGVYGRTVAYAREAGFAHGHQNPDPHGKSQYEVAYNDRSSVPVPPYQRKYIFEPSGEYLEQAFQKLTAEAQPERYAEGVVGSGIGSTGRGGGPGGKSVQQRMHEKTHSGMATEMYLPQPASRKPTTLAQQEPSKSADGSEARTPLVIPRSKRQLYQSARVSQYDGHIPELITSHGVISSDFANEEYDARVPTPDLHKPAEERYYNKLHTDLYEIGPTPIGHHAWDEVEKTRRWKQYGRQQIETTLKARADSAKTKPSMLDPFLNAAKARPRPASASAGRSVRIQEDHHQHHHQHQQHEAAMSKTMMSKTMRKTSSGSAGSKANPYKTLDIHHVDYTPAASQQEINDAHIATLRDSGPAVHEEVFEMTTVTELNDPYVLSVPVSYVF